MRAQTTRRHPSLLWVRLLGGGFLAGVILAGFFSWHDSRMRARTEILANLRHEAKMLAGLLADEERQLRVLTAMARRGDGRLLRLYLASESRRIPAFVLYDARGRRRAAWGQVPPVVPARLAAARVRRSPRFRDDWLLPLGHGPHSVVLLIRRDRELGWAALVVKRGLLHRLLFTPIPLTGNRLSLHAGARVLARRVVSGVVFPAPPGLATFLDSGPLSLSVPLVPRGTNLVLTSRVSAAALAALWWRRNFVAVILVAVLLVALVVVERALSASLASEMALQEEREKTTERQLSALKERLDLEQHLKDIKEVYRLLNDAVARHLPEQVLFRRATEILASVPVGRGFWFAVYNWEGLEEAADVTTASGWSLFMGPEMDHRRLVTLYGSPPTRLEKSPEKPAVGTLDPLQQLLESGEDVFLPDAAERTDLDPRWHALVETRNASGLCLAPILRDPLLVGQFGLLCSREDEEDESREIVRGFALEVARILSYGLTDLAARQALEYAGFHDLLTGLPNRQLFYDRMQQLLRGLERDGTPFGVAILDLDGFKEVNDTYGHLIGDRVLATLAGRMREFLRAADTVARLGGDEFALLLPRLSSETAQAFLDRLRSSLVRPFDLAVGTLDVTPSLGLALAPRDGNDRDRLLRAADSALYRAKKSGRGVWLVYDENRDAQVLRPLRALPLAVESAPATVRLEPEIDAARGVMSGLILQRYDATGVRPLPALAAGLNDEAHQEILALLSAVRPLHAFPAPRPGLTLSVPFPVGSLARDEATHEILAALAPFQAQGWRTLVVLMADDPEMTPSVRLGVRHLRRLGVTVGWQFDPDCRYRPDELARFEIDRMTLAPELVSELPRRLWPSAIVSSLLAAADLLDIHVSARGVGRPEAVEILTLLGCRYLAGPWVGAALKPENALEGLSSLMHERWDGRSPLPQGTGGFGDLPLLLFRSTHEPWLDRSYVRLYLRRRGRPPPSSECSLGGWLVRRRATVTSAAVRRTLDRLAHVHDAFHTALRTHIEEEGGELRRYDPAVFLALWPEFEAAVAAVRTDLTTSSSAGLA